jgi:hypothetical protein
MGHIHCRTSRSFFCVEGKGRGALVPATYAPEPVSS